MMTPSSGDNALDSQVAIGLVEQPIASRIRQCASSFLDKDPMTHSWDPVRWNRISSVFHGHWKVFSIEKLDWLKITFEPISKCYHIIIHAGTGNTRANDW